MRERAGLRVVISGTPGIDATRLITAGDDPARVIVLTTFDDDDCVYGALHAGASGFLVKDMALDDILTAIRAAAGGLASASGDPAAESGP
jgi:DNA-binding NarL/FixJ family response regulator